MRFKEFLKEDNQFLETKEEIQAWMEEILEKSGDQSKFVVNDDLTVDVYGSLDLSGETHGDEGYLLEFENGFPVQFGEVTDDFSCYNMGMTSLKGAPREVGGNFICDTNRLTSLQYGPKEVAGYYDCSDNDLTTLKGAPREITDTFDCNSNLLKNLDGGPKEIGLDLEAGNNQLKDLSGSIKVVHGDVYVKNNAIRENSDLSGIDVKGEIIF